MDCTFENDLCQWTQDQPGTIIWNRVQASDKVYNTAPILDVTTGTGKCSITIDSYWWNISWDSYTIQVTGPVQVI